MTAEAREVASRDGVTDRTRGLVFELPAEPAAASGLVGTGPGREYCG